MSSGNQLDNIFTNLNSESITGVIYVTDISDHYGQYLRVNTTLVKRQRFSRRRFYSARNIDRFRGQLEAEDWVSISQACDPESRFDIMLGVILYYFDLSFPVTTYRIDSSTNWITAEVRGYSEYVRDLYILSRRTNSPLIHDWYKAERKKYRRLVVNSKRCVNDSMINNSGNKTKTVWKIFNAETNKKARKQITLKLDSGEFVDDPRQLVELFSNYFDVPYRERAIEYRGGEELQESIYLLPVDRHEICGILRDLPNKHGAGVDEIPTFILRHVADQLSQPLAEIINECLVAGCFPSSLKIAKVIPVFKKGSRVNIKNYRPISLLPSLSKVFERVIYNRLMGFLSRHKIFTQHQYGFLPSKSTQLAIFTVVSYITEGLDRGENVAGLFFDLSKAFDTINHELLIQKLCKYGIRGVPAQLIRSYLSGRRQRLSITRDSEEYLSGDVEITQGVPQGSILGPILFVLYVNDLSGGPLPGLLCQYADDTSAVLTAASLLDLSGGCSRIADYTNTWCNNNCLRLNADKTSLMTFRKQGTSDWSLYVTCNGKTVQEATCTKFLGMHLDQTLSWEKQIHAVISSINSSCAVIRRLRDVVSLESLRVFYFSSVQSVIDYGILLWGSASNAQAVFRTQKRIVRCMLRLHPRTSCRPYFGELGLHTVPSLYFRALVMFVKKHQELFQINSDFYSDDMTVVTRNRAELAIPAHHSTFYEKGPHYRAIKAFQVLPTEIRRTNNLGAFKRAVDNYLRQQCFYTFNF